MSRPRLLDLFCCEGGAAVGYHRAGFEVVGVDLEPRFAKRYPYEFHQRDALKLLGDVDNLDTFDVIHASPPCQRYTHGNVAGNQASKHPDLIGPVRELLQAWGGIYVIENVPRSPLIDPLILCGSMFDLTTIDDDSTRVRLERHRHFESNILLLAPRADHHDKTAWVAGSYGGARRDKLEAKHIRKGGYVPSIPVQQRLLGIDWMTQHGMHQSVPPAYTEYIGTQLLDALRAAA